MRSLVRECRARQGGLQPTRATRSQNYRSGVAKLIDPKRTGLRETTFLTRTTPNNPGATVADPGWRRAGDAPSTTRSGQSHPDHIQRIDPNRQPPYTMRQVTGQKGNDQVAFVVAFGDLAQEAGAQAIAKLVAAAIK